MTTSPHVPDDDAPPPRDEDFDDAGRYVGDDPERVEDDRAFGDDRTEPLAEGDDDDEGLSEEPPAIQPRTS